MNPRKSTILAQRRRRGREGLIDITITEYVQRHASLNPNANVKELTLRLRRALEAKTQGAQCDCGEPIWALGSAEVGFACFTCITGEAVPNADYEIVAAR